MPELPEVEVVKRSLTSKIQKLVVEKITVKDEKLRYRINKKKLKILLGLKIIKILRRSKFLLFIFEKNTPATFTYPIYSLMADWVMFKDIIIGKIKC